MGLNPDVEGEGYDRGFALPVAQQQLIAQVVSANPRTIVVLSGGAAIDMRAWIERVPVVLQTWYLGQSAGTALASILFGDAIMHGKGRMVAMIAGLLVALVAATHLVRRHFSAKKKKSAA